MEKTFWVTNISNRNVMLSDLNVMIRSMSSVNLLDSKHYYLTEDQLVKSITSGSMYLKRDKIVKRIVPIIPEMLDDEHKLKIDYHTIIPSRQRSVLEVKIEEYDELKLSDDHEENLNKEFEAIAETSDTVDYDRQPLIPKK